MKTSLLPASLAVLFTLMLSMLCMPAFAQDNCHNVVGARCPGCGTVSGQSAIKDGITCSACSQWCWAFKPADGSAPVVRKIDMESAVVDGATPAKSNHPAIAIDQATLVSVGQINPMAALALRQLAKPEFATSLNVVAGSMTAPTKPTVQTLMLVLSGVTDEAAQEKTMLPLSALDSYSEVTWKGIRTASDTLVVHFDAREVSKDRVATDKMLAPSIDVTIKGTTSPKVTKWQVAGD